MTRQGVSLTMWTLRTIAAVALAALAIWTSRNRWGAGIALLYLSRVYGPDPADPIPPAGN